MRPAVFVTGGVALALALATLATFACPALANDPHVGKRAHAPPKPRFERDVIHAIRLDEEFKIRVKDSHGKVTAAALHSFERLMRQHEATHPPDPRLVALVAIVSNHFGGRTLEVVSGYRAYTPTQYTPHSNHNFGKALDFGCRAFATRSSATFAAPSGTRAAGTIRTARSCTWTCGTRRPTGSTFRDPASHPATNGPAPRPTRARAT